MISLIFISDDYSDSDATYFSGSDDDDAVEDDGVLLEKWIPPLFYLAKGIK